MNTHVLSVAIFGRPNVGKSTLFNRILGKKIAIVADYAGVTRDWKAYTTTWNGISLRLLDTPGLEKRSLQTWMETLWKSAKEICQESDIVLFLIDALTGITPDDIVLAQWLREQSVDVRVVMNKAERIDFSEAISEGSRLGFGLPILVSALHGQGMDRLEETFKTFQKSDHKKEEKFEHALGPSVVVLGRPNVGKSTLINSFLGKERLLTGPEAGITRDCISIPLVWKGKSFQFVDTAGLRKKGHVTEALERKACGETYHALVFSQVAVLLLDATRGIEKQDLVILNKIVQEGRSVVVGLNKWDLAQDKTALFNGVENCLARQCHVSSVPLIPLCGKTGTGFDRLCEAIFSVYRLWEKRIATGPLNAWLEKTLKAHPPPLMHGQRIRIKYATQVKTRPPTFAIFGNQLAVLPEDYRRYLTNSLINDFDFRGVPVRLLWRQGINPFDKANGSS